MCRWGDTVDVYVRVADDRWETKPIDRCIAPIVKALQRGHIWTVNSCCGHGRGPGSILLEDGREIVIRSDWEFSSARVLSAPGVRLWERIRAAWLTLRGTTIVTDSSSHASTRRPHPEEMFEVLNAMLEDESLPQEMRNRLLGVYAVASSTRFDVVRENKSLYEENASMYRRLNDQARRHQLKR